jgi:hypothetical protein
MSTRTISTLVGTGFFLALLQLVAGLVNLWAAIVCGALLAPLGFGLLLFFEVDLENKWILGTEPAAASLVSTAILYLGSVRGTDLRLWFAPLAALAASGVILGIRAMRSERCGLCNHRLGRGVAFPCPRCGLVVCEQNCWVFEQSRCRLCEQNRVPAFPPDGRWWDRQFGPRSPHGRCLICMTAADQADLRACGKCGRPQCRDCWDYANGQCSRCQWTVADLPEPLRAYAVTPASTGRSRRV